jgi:hypothetical protein
MNINIKIILTDVSLQPIGSHLRGSRVHTYLWGATAQIGVKPCLCEVSGSHKHGRTPLDEWSARVQRPQPTQNKTNTRGEHPCPKQDSNPHSQQSSVRRPTPWSAQPPAAVMNRLCLYDYRVWFWVIKSAQICYWTPPGTFCISARYLWTVHEVESSWNVMAHGDAREGKWRGNWRMEWVASTLHTTSEHGVSSITTADAHTSAASSQLNWRPRRLKWTRPFRRKTKSGVVCFLLGDSPAPEFYTGPAMYI